MFLSITNGDVIKLINYLNKTGFTSLNILFDSNPNILSLEPFEISNYINVRIKNGETMDEVIDDLDSNPYLFDDI